MGFISNINKIVWFINCNFGTHYLNNMIYKMISLIYLQIDIKIINCKGIK